MVMIRVECIKQFKLSDFDKLKNIKRKSIDVKGLLFVGDTFECDEEMVKYLTGNNEDGDVVVRVIEIEPEIKKMPIGESAQPIEKVIETKIEELKPKKKKSSKK